MTTPIRIGTRGSELAIWQANKVKELLAEKGHKSELKIIQSAGDKDRKAKLHEMGLVGVFTKELDDALLLGEIDVAVHSLKDVPTSPPKGVVQCAVLKRANPYDVLISSCKFKDTEKFTLASGSLRRRAFWQNKYPAHVLENLRGNVPTRFEKIDSEAVDGIILAKAGLDRLDLAPKHLEILDWMTPAPAQGIVGVFCLNKSKRLKTCLSEINDKNTEICAQVERDLLKELEGGCTAPIGAHARIVKRSVEVKASLLSVDGKTHVHQVNKKGLSAFDKLGKETAKAILDNGGKELMEALKKSELNKLDSDQEKETKPVLLEKETIELREKSVGKALVIEENEIKPKPLSVKMTTITLKENSSEKLLDSEIEVPELEEIKIVLKPISIKRTTAATEENPSEKPIEKKELTTEDIKIDDREKLKDETLAALELKSIRIKQSVIKEASLVDRFPKVLCLKKLTPPRINAGRKLGLGLTAVEVIETQPDFESYAVSYALKSTNNWVFSSLNSVSAITSVLKSTSMIHKHVFCVGPRAANFFDGKVKAIHQVNSASELTEVAKASEIERFMWFHGNKSDMALIDEFETHEMTLNSHPVYKTEHITPKIEDLKDYQALVFFSPSGVDSFNEHNYIPESTVVSAIGKTTAEYIALKYDDQENTKLENIITPEIYEYEHLLQALRNHFDTNGKD
jgi:hydroxymethylbilane synthase